MGCDNFLDEEQQQQQQQTSEETKIQLLQLIRNILLVVQQLLSEIM